MSWAFCHVESALVITLEGFGGKTGNLPLHEPGGGSALRVWRWGARTFPNADADSGELFGLPSSVLLHHVQSLPHFLEVPPMSEGGISDEELLKRLAATHSEA